MTLAALAVDNRLSHDTDRPSPARSRVVARETLTWANGVTALRIAAGFAAFAAFWATGLLKWGLLGLAVYWVGDVLDGWLARRLRQETLFGAQFDILADRILVCLFYLCYVSTRPGKAPAALLFLFEFAVLDHFLSNQFMRWRILSPNYFYMVDLHTWRWLWSTPAKAFNCGLVTLLLIGLPTQWPALVVTVVLIAIRVRLTYRMMVLCTALQPPLAPTEA